MGILTTLIQRDRWEELEEWLGDNDSDFVITEMNRVDRLGRSPLHYACAKKMAPAHIVYLMLDSVSILKAVTMVDICGNSLLHVAAASGNAKVVRVLLERFATYPHVRRVNDVGMTPLMMAWKKHLDASFSLFSTGRSSSLMSPKVSENVYDLLHVQSVSDLQHKDGLRDLWDKTCAVCQVAALTGSSRVSGSGCVADTWTRRPLHSLISFGGQHHVKCPTIALWLSIRFFPRHLLERDEDGNLPLHLAILAKEELPVMPIHVGDQSPLASIAATPAVAMLAKANSETARMADREGRLPLHLALQYGKDAALALLAAYPSAMDQRDPVTKLFPALQAATTRACSLSLVYELMKARPDLILRALECPLETLG